MTSFTHSHTDGRSHLFIRRTFTNIYTLANGRHLGLRVLPEDTSTWTSGAGDRTADPLIEGRPRSPLLVLNGFIVYRALPIESSRGAPSVLIEPGLQHRTLHSSLQQVAVFNSKALKHQRMQTAQHRAVT